MNKRSNILFEKQRNLNKTSTKNKIPLREEEREENSQTQKFQIFGQKRI